jgi:hypothetical protein
MLGLWSRRDFNIFNLNEIVRFFLQYGRVIVSIYQRGVILGSLVLIKETTVGCGLVVGIMALSLCVTHMELSVGLRRLVGFLDELHRLFLSSLPSEWRVM